MIYKSINKLNTTLSSIGVGTGIGGFQAKYAEYPSKQIKGIQLAIDLGVNFIDTAEEYGNGQAEINVGKSIKGIRDKIFIGTKLSSKNYKRKSLIKSAEDSLKRMKIDYIDLYQLHWPNPLIDLEETTDGLMSLIEENKIKYVGVSNFSLIEIERFSKLMKDHFISVQDEYNIVNRTAEKNIIPYCNKKDIFFIGYSPFNQGRAVKEKKILTDLSIKYDKKVEQILLNWIISKDNILAIPRSLDSKHIELNCNSSDFKIEDDEIDLIDHIFSSKSADIDFESVKLFGGKNEDNKVYKTIDEAINNILNFSPSPVELSISIKNGEQLKPIKVKKIYNDSKYSYIIQDGRLRYWAHVIICHEQNKKLVPVLIQD